MGTAPHGEAALPSRTAGVFPRATATAVARERMCLPVQAQHPLDQSPELAKHLACSFTTGRMRHPGPGHPALSPGPAVWTGKGSSVQDRGGQCFQGAGPPAVGSSVGDGGVWITTATLPTGELRGEGLLQASEPTLAARSPGSSWGCWEGHRCPGDPGRLPALLGSPARSLHCFHSCCLIGLRHREQKGPWGSSN